MANLPQVLDQNHVMGASIAEPTLLLLQVKYQIIKISVRWGGCPCTRRLRNQIVTTRTEADWGSNLHKITALQRNHNNFTTNARLLTLGKHTFFF